MKNDNLTSEQESLFDVLNEYHIAELPEELNAELEGKAVWLSAVVKVRKCNGKVNYAMAVNDGYGNPRVIRDYGSPAAIVGIESIYPVKTLDRSNFPSTKDKNKCITYLASNGIDKDLLESLYSDINPDGSVKSKKSIDAGMAKIKEMLDYNVINDAIRNNCLI